MVEVHKLRTSCDFCGARATLCGDSCGRGSKTADFLRFLRCARDPLRRFAWSRLKNCGLFTISARRARPSAEIVRVEALSLWRRANLANPLRRLCVEALSLWRRAVFLLATRPLEVVSWFARLLSQSRGRGFDSPLVRGSSGLKIAAFKYKRSTRSVLPQLRLENRNF